MSIQANIKWLHHFVYYAIGHFFWCPRQALLQYRTALHGGVLRFGPTKIMFVLFSLAFIYTSPAGLAYAGEFIRTTGSTGSSPLVIPSSWSMPALVSSEYFCLELSSFSLLLCYLYQGLVEAVFQRLYSVGCCCSTEHTHLLFWYTGVEVCCRPTLGNSKHSEVPLKLENMLRTLIIEFLRGASGNDISTSCIIRCCSNTLTPETHVRRLCIGCFRSNSIGEKLLPMEPLIFSSCPYVRTIDDPQQFHALLQPQESRPNLNRREGALVRCCPSQTSLDIASLLTVPLLWAKTYTPYIRESLWDGPNR